MRKKFLEKKLARLTEKKTSLRAKAEASQDAAEVRSLTEELEDVNVEIEEVREELEMIETEEKAAAEEESRNSVPANATLVNGKVAESFKIEEKRDAEDKYSSMEYRKQFMAFVQRGERPDSKYDMESRSAAVANTTKYAAVIPTTVMNEIIKDLEDEYGGLYKIVRKLNIPGGVKFPVADLEVTWHWIAEDAVSETQDAGTANTYVSFTYNIGEARVAESLLLNITILADFEREFASEIAKAYLKAMDYGIVNGDGSGEMLGILQDARLTTTLAATNIIEMTVEDMEDWVAWRQKFIAKIPRKYRKNATFVFAGETVDAHLAVIRDKNDRPLYVEAAGLDMDDSNEGRFLGKPCQIVDSSILEDVDSAEAGDYVGIFGDFSRYAINSNREFVVDKWEDKDSNKVITRGLAVVDGKMLLPNAFFLIKKKASTPSL